MAVPEQCQGPRQLLVPGSSWVSEGFDTADLQEAKVMLEEFA